MPRLSFSPCRPLPFLRSHRGTKKDGVPGGLIIKNRPKSRPNSIELSFVSYSFVKIWNPA